MALKINVALTDQSGLLIPTGSVVRLQVIFPATGLEMHYNLHVYKSENSFDENDNPIESRIYPTELANNLGIVRTMTLQEFASMTPIDAQDWLKDYLEALPGIGIGNIEII